MLMRKVPLSEDMELRNRICQSGITVDLHGDKLTVSDTLEIEVVKEWEGGKCLISCPSLPVFTFGNDERHAESMLKEAVWLFFDACDDTILLNIIGKHQKRNFPP